MARQLLPSFLSASSNAFPIASAPFLQGLAAAAPFLHRLAAAAPTAAQGCTGAASCLGLTAFGTHVLPVPHSALHCASAKIGDREVAQGLSGADVAPHRTPQSRHQPVASSHAPASVQPVPGTELSPGQALASDNHSSYRHSSINGGPAHSSSSEGPRLAPWLRAGFILSIARCLACSHSTSSKQLVCPTYHRMAGPELPPLGRSRSCGYETAGPSSCPRAGFATSATDLLFVGHAGVGQNSSAAISGVLDFILSEAPAAGGLQELATGGLKSASAAMAGVRQNSPAAPLLGAQSCLSGAGNCNRGDLGCAGRGLELALQTRCFPGLHVSSALGVTSGTGHRPDELKRWVVLPPSAGFASASTATQFPPANHLLEGGLPTIRTLVVANRGEIACRVIKTAKELGIKTVAVYSEADAGALHTRMADEAFCIGPAPSDQSYLQIRRVLDVAARVGAQAIHPGYGFLSENAKFAEMCRADGVEFVGPPAAAITAMGDKSTSKSLMAAAGVPVVPGFHGEEQDADFLLAEGDKIGYPLMIKARQGGGGKGMRLVHSRDQFLDALASAQRESQASFGDQRVLLERYVVRPRHVEVQVFADKHGGAVYLFERDCSVQRRHQKVIEEAPAPGVSSDFRQQIGRAAVEAAKAVGYVNAGTVEFIVDPLTMKFFFMEMNTRLQVEHPVTEMVTGLDLVEWQLRVAAGERLPLRQEELRLNGHSFETRIYAENVPRGFLPAGGRLRRCRPPSPETGAVRVETGVREGDVIGTYYDPMIAKLVVWGRSRKAALVKLQQALGGYQVAGTPTNIPFLKSLTSHPVFMAGAVDTGFIERYMTDLVPQPEGEAGFQLTVEAAAMEAEGRSKAGRITMREAEREAMAVAAAGLCIREQCGGDRAGLTPSWSSSSGFRLSSDYIRRFSLAPASEAGTVLPSTPIDVLVRYKGIEGFSVEVGGRPAINVSGHPLSGDSRELLVKLAGRSMPASLVDFTQGGARQVHLWLAGHHFHFTLPIRVEWGGHPMDHHVGKGSVVTPMPGRVVKRIREDGERVRKGDPVLILEAMKMEHVVRAPLDGVVRNLGVKPGGQVEDGKVLFVVAEDAPEKQA